MLLIGILTTAHLFLGNVLRGIYRLVAPSGRKHVIASPLMKHPYAREQ